MLPHCALRPQEPGQHCSIQQQGCRVGTFLLETTTEIVVAKNQAELLFVLDSNSFISGVFHKLGYGSQPGSKGCLVQCEPPRSAGWIITSLQLMVLTKENVAAHAVAEQLVSLRLPDHIQQKIGRLAGYYEQNRKGSYTPLDIPLSNRNQSLRQKSLIIGCGGSGKRVACSALCPHFVLILTTDSLNSNTANRSSFSDQ